MSVSNDPMTFDFSDAPGGDANLDDIFATNEGSQNGTPPTDQTHQPDDTSAAPFLKTATGTVYNSADDAVKGIEHKDALIAQLRQQVADRTGKDPIRASKDDESQVTYMESPEKYFADIKKAKTEKEVLEVQQRFVAENLAPYAPLIASMAKTRALEEVSTEIPEVRQFLHSDGYSKVLESYPLLKRSIEIAETNPQAAADLPQLYRMAYSSSLGLNLPKLVQTTPGNPPVAARPTVSSTPQALPRVQQVAPNLATSDGRKAIMAEQEARGVGDLRF